MVEAAATQVIAVLTVVLMAPLLKGVIDNLKAKVQSRRGPSILQPYYDLAKLFQKERMRTPNTSLIFRSAL
jgi:formate hydrogenlyase subunit 4